MQTTPSYHVNHCVQQASFIAVVKKATLRSNRAVLGTVVRQLSTLVATAMRPLTVILLAFTLISILVVVQSEPSPVSPNGRDSYAKPTPSAANMLITVQRV